ncbi:related to ATP dependent RNA helicase [Phialocephala subalpina]|uniref:ATP-dependent RNA helicase n=1 Tax=Phialocephala subalpina TaxID=576137 RepID=A0A1L7XXA4_9HELO|nr:related to ATP dependent RNA helicase [Phialocephala subalpina]
MASQIYSRYIPPSKKKCTTLLPFASHTPSTPNLESSISTPPATRQDASSTYARYIPSSKKKPGPTITPNIPPADLQLPSPKSKRKHEALKGDQDNSSHGQSKKHKKNTEEPGYASIIPPNPSQESGLIHTADQCGLEEDEENVKATKKRKKEKKGKGLYHSSDLVAPEIPGEAQEDEDDEVDDGTKPKKQKKKKKEKSSDVVSTRVGEEGEDVAEEDDVRHKKLLKKREKSRKKAEKLAEKDTVEATGEEPEETTFSLEAEEEEVHDLVPLPQPEPIPELPPVSITASLPPWLASPIRVSPTSTSIFQDIGLSDGIAEALQSKGFSQALPVQAAVLPLLLPGKPQLPGDVLVSAATGSGKTLAYVLPMIEDISRNHHTGIRGLIIVPTRELVAQARQVCELCVSAFAKAGGYSHRPIIGTAVGNETLQAEQEALVGEELIFDPAGYDAELKAANAPWESAARAMEERVLFPEHEFKARIPGHVIKPFVRVDVLICTPGRLVEHLKSTPGFSLEHVRWLAVDEADKLLDQSFQQWLDIVMGQIHSSKRSIRDRVRKIILSATMTSDIGQLTSLKLYRPKLVVLEGPTGDGTDSGQQLSLPALLKESAVKVEGEIIKPLYLVELLRRAKLLSGETIHSTRGSVSSDTDSSDSESESDDSTTDSDLDSETSPKPTSEETTHRTTNTPSVLIFTKSNETAVRLSRLITILCPSASSKLGTLTSTTPRKSRQRTILSFSSGKVTILVASDLVSRGLDLPDLAHVINYDVPTSLTSYVHRIGRTARAGKEGHAWTLFTEREGGWFWREIARNPKVQRVEGANVVRVNITKEFFDDERQKYEDALEKLEREASRNSGKQDELK